MFRLCKFLKNWRQKFFSVFEWQKMKIIFQKLEIEKKSFLDNLKFLYIWILHYVIWKLKKNSIAIFFKIQGIWSVFAFSQKVPYFVYFQKRIIKWTNEDEYARFLSDSDSQNISYFLVKYRNYIILKRKFDALGTLWAKNWSYFVSYVRKSADQIHYVHIHSWKFMLNLVIPKKFKEMLRSFRILRKLAAENVHISIINV